MRIEVIDPVADYADLMQSLFDFGAIRALFGRGFTMRFDAMSAVSGPYAKTIFEHMLGAPAGTVMHGKPLEDFGGHHPDPNPVNAAELIAYCREKLAGYKTPKALDFRAELPRHETGKLYKGQLKAEYRAAAERKETA